MSTNSDPTIIETRVASVNPSSSISVGSVVVVSQSSSPSAHSVVYVPLGLPLPGSITALCNSLSGYASELLLRQDSSREAKFNDFGNRPTYSNLSIILQIILFIREINLQSNFI